MKKKNIILLIVILLSTLVSFLTIAPTNMDYESKGYNSKNALENLQVISSQRHSVTDYEGHEEVRKFLLEKTKAIVGEENVVERNYLTASNTNPNDGIVYVDSNVTSSYEIDETYDIRNILATIPGKNEMGLLLVAHYDSRGNIKRPGELAASYGAGDDGYGVVTLLEIMSYIKNNSLTLTNSLYFLFTDAEETGMYGSFLESKNTELMNKVNFVINVEARGMDGAAYMFETSKNNNKVIKMYQEAKDPVSYSIAPAVYSVMTNFTDFTNFLEVGKNGLNFSTLNDINDYHVPTDNYSNANPASLQHYGSQILPIVLEYIAHEKYSDINYFNGTHDMIFFNVIPGVFVVYSSVIGIILALILLIAVGLYIFFNIRKKEFNVKKFFKNIGFVFLGLLIAIVLGQIVSMFVARINGYPWSLVNVRSSSSNIIVSLFMIFILVLSTYLMNKVSKTEEDRKTYLLAATVINVFLCVLTSFVLSGASFVFIVPSILGCIYLYVTTYCHKPWAKMVAFYASIVISILIFVPLITSLLFALTIGGLLALALLSFIPFTILIPMFNDFEVFSNKTSS